MGKQELSHDEFIENGMHWKRTAGKEFATIDEKVWCMVTPGESNRFGWCIYEPSDNLNHIFRFGYSDTRPEARRSAYFALVKHTRGLNSNREFLVDRIRSISKWMFGAMCFIAGFWLAAILVQVMR